MLFDMICKQKMKYFCEDVVWISTGGWISNARAILRILEVSLQTTLNSISIDFSVPLALARDGISAQLLSETVCAPARVRILFCTRKNLLEFPKILYLRGLGFPVLLFVIQLVPSFFFCTHLLLYVLKC